MKRVEYFEILLIIATLIIMVIALDYEALLLVLLEIGLAMLIIVPYGLMLVAVLALARIAEKVVLRLYERDQSTHGGRIDKHDGLSEREIHDTVGGAEETPPG